MGIRDELTGQAEKIFEEVAAPLLEVTDRSLNGMKILKKQIHITAIFPSSMSCIREEGLPRKHQGAFMRLREPVFYGEGSRNRLESGMEDSDVGKNERRSTYRKADE